MHKNVKGVRPALALVVGLVCLATLFVGRVIGDGIPHSPLMGLATLHQLADTAVPYKVAMASARPVMVEFYADWCSVCQSMAPLVESLHQQYGETIDFVMVNVDEPQWGSVLKQYGVRGVPHYAFIASDHTSVESLVGSYPLSIIVQKLEALS